MKQLSRLGSSIAKVSSMVPSESHVFSSMCCEYDDDDGEDDSDWDFGKKVKGNKTNRSGSVVAVRKRDKGLL